MSHPNTRPSGPGQSTATARPAICEAIAPSRRSFARVSCQAAPHHATTASSAAAAPALTHTGVLGCTRVMGRVSAPLGPP